MIPEGTGRKGTPFHLTCRTGSLGRTTDQSSLKKALILRGSRSFTFFISLCFFVFLYSNNNIPRYGRRFSLNPRQQRRTIQIPPSSNQRTYQSRNQSSRQHGQYLCSLKQQFDFFWVGFYLVEGNELVLGPFQGPVACTRIAYNRGVCGSAWAKEETLVVPNVDEFPGHIACSSLSKSEIVVPILKDGKCIGVLDVDSADLNSFDDVDVKYLLQIIKYFVENII